MYFFWPLCLSSQEWVRRLPSTYTLLPFFRYSPTISAVRDQAVMLCHSVRSCHCPSLSLKRSFVARVNFATGVPEGVYFTSGSLPRLPRRMTLLTLFPAMNALLATALGELSLFRFGQYNSFFSSGLNRWRAAFRNGNRGHSLRRAPRYRRESGSRGALTR